RTQLARDLHDVVLNNLASLRHSLGHNPPPGYLEAYTRAVTSLRQTISGLRPPLLDYGLYQALKALAGDHDYREDEPLPTLAFNLPESEERYDLKVEEQAYRIVQQAYENALQHANAGAIAMRGELAPGSIDLVVEDDGIGLAADAPERQAASDERKRFGLRGMRERAALIGAELEVTQTEGHGTRVRVRWRADVPDNG
ncbi:MAG: sensor histidine kinase, partial [Anaerolineales bacterium]